MQIYCVKMAPELCVIMCESNNPVRYVRLGIHEYKKGPCFEFTCAGNMQARSLWENFNTGDLVILA